MSVIKFVPPAGVEIEVQRFTYDTDGDGAFAEIVLGEDHDRLLTRLQEERDGLKADAGHKVILVVQDICELEPADANDPECICITASDLGRILSRHFEGIE